MKKVNGSGRPKINGTDRILIPDKKAKKSQSTIRIRIHKTGINASIKMCLVSTTVTIKQSRISGGASFT